MLRTFYLIAIGLLLSITASSYAQDPEDPTLPDIIVTPQDEPFASDTETDFEQLRYPNLSQLVFGQGGPFDANTGIFRGPISEWDTPRAVSIVTQELIRERQAADMGLALQNTVGVLVQSTAAGQASPFIRGLTGQQVMLLIDGIRMNNSIYRNGPNQYFNTIDPGMVNHLEVLRGPSSVLWGSDAIGGAINVVTRSADVDYGMCCGDYRQREFTQYFNTSNISPYSRLNLQGWVGQMGVFTGSSYMNVRNLDTGWWFGRQPGTNYQQYAGDLKFNYLIDEWQLLTVSLQHFEQEDLPRSDRFPGYPGDRNMSNTAANARFFNPQQRDLIYLRYQAVEPCQWSDAVMITASLNRQGDNQTRGIPTTRFQKTFVNTTGVSIVSSKELGDEGRVVVGVDWYNDHVDSSFGGAATEPIIPDNSTYNRIGGFLNWDTRLTDSCTATAGVRWERVNATSTPIVDVMGVPTPIPISPAFSDWVFQVGFEHELGDYVKLVGSVSEGFRAPNLDDLAGNNPNVLQTGVSLPSLNLQPERPISYEVGIKTNFPRLRTQTFVYWFDMQDNIVPIIPDPMAPSDFALANQDSYIQGVEFNGEYLCGNGWSLYGNFWYTYGINNVINAPLSRIPPTQGIVGFRWRDPDLLAYFDVYAWLSRRQDRLNPVKDVQDERIPIGGTPGFITYNARIGRTLGDRNQHRLSLSVENILDQPFLVHGSGVFGTGITGRFGYEGTY